MTQRFVLPPRAPRYRSILRLQRFMQNPIPFMNDNLKKYGDTYCFSLRYNKVNILTIDPDVIQHILRKNAANYDKAVAPSSALERFVGTGLLLAIGEAHTKQRKLMAPGFRPKSLSNLIDLMDREIDHYFDELDNRISQNPQVSIDDEMRKMTFRVMSKAIYGNDMNHEMNVAFFNRFQTLQEFLVKLVRLPSMMKYYNLTGKTSYYEQVSKENNDVLLELIQQRRKKGAGEDLLGMLMSCQYDDGTGMTDQQLLQESLILFVAGHETASNILSWIFYLLSQHPDCVQKIKAEAEGLPDGVPSFNELLKLEYLSQTIDECLRLYPPSWITDRVAKEDDHVKGFDIPKGARVIPFIYGLHHSEKLWSDPEVFNPGRFSKEGRQGRHNFAHMPFGAGPRMCIGRNFAMMEMKMIILKLLKRYDFELLKNQKIAILPAVTLKPKNPIQFNFQLQA